MFKNVSTSNFTLQNIKYIYDTISIYGNIWLDFYQLNNNMIKIYLMIWFLFCFFIFFNLNLTCEGVTLFTSNLTNELYMFILIFKDKNLAPSKLENMYKSQK